MYSHQGRHRLCDDQYSHKSQEFDYAVEKLEEVDDSVLQEQWNHVAPNTQHVENQDDEVKSYVLDLVSDKVEKTLFVLC
jgi:hypothetical protein